MKTALTILFGCSVLTAFSQANACASAGSLTIDGALTCGQTTSGATLQAGECYTDYSGGSTEVSVWYRVDVTNDSLVLNFILSNSPNCFPHISVYGPFANGAGCVPGCGSTVYSALQNGDPGSHILLTGLSTTPGNNDYLIQVQGNQCGGPGATATTFCINVANPDVNVTAGSASLIDECGTAFNETTNGGYWQNGTSTGFNNLDGNNTTTCTGCSQAGDDTPFVINNVSWTTFCSLTAGTWQVTVNGISGCNNSSPNQGVQASVFTGTSTALVNAGNSASPIPPGGSYTSPVITVNAGSCAFLMIDGFAGDACNYSVTLTNISGGCALLGVELGDFNVYRNATTVKLSWEALSEFNNSHYTLERSVDGAHFVKVTDVQSVGDHSYAHTYSFEDEFVRDHGIYYRLSQTDKNGKSKILAVKYLNGLDVADDNYFLLYPNPATNAFSIEFAYPMQATQATVEIFGISSQVYRKEIVDVKNGVNLLQFDTEDLPEGHYVVKVITPSKTFTEKLVKTNP